MGSATDRTPTARTTARGKATTPPNASSCVENLTDTTNGNFHEHLQTQGLEPYAGRRGGRGAEGKYRQQPYPNDSGARWSQGHPLEQQKRRRQDTDPGLAGMRTASPEDVATRTGIILRAGAAEAGARASGRCHRLIFRRICRRMFRGIFRLDNFPTHRGTLLRQIIPTRTNT